MKTANKALITAIAMIAAIACSPINALAYSVNDDHSIFGLGQVWVGLSEDAKNDAKAADGSDGTDSAFGFKAKRFRFGFKGKMVDGQIGYKIQTEFAGTSAGLKDYVMSVNPTDTASITIGQFKPFVTFDGLRSAAKLKSIERAKAMKDVSGGFFLTNNSFRDLGASLKLKKLGPVDLLISATNGTGAGDARDVGGSVSSGAVFANKAGDAAYSVGAIVNLADGMVRLNGSYSMNKHDNAVAKADKTTAIYIDRTAYSAGFEVDLKDVDLWLDGEYASLDRGSDDVSGEGSLTGYYVRAGFWIMPKTLEIVARYESEDDKGISKGTKDDAYTTTGISAGLNYYIEKNFKTQLEYVSFDPETGDSYGSIRANLQVTF